MTLNNYSKETSSSFNVSDAADVTTERNMIKEVLKSRLFLGQYVERQLVDNIGYRDIVLLSEAEVDLKRDLMEIKKKLLSLNYTHWIGVTDVDKLGYSHSGVCLWTEIFDQPFGYFWFQVKTVLFRENEVMLKLKCIRHISESYIELAPILTHLNVKHPILSKRDFVCAPNQESVVDFLATIKSLFTVTNLKELVTFIFALVIAVFTGGVAFINFLGNFVLALVRETSILVNNATPMFLGLLDFFSKIVGGFYILLAMLFKQNTPVTRQNKSLDYANNQQYRNHFD